MRQEWQAATPSKPAVTALRRAWPRALERPTRLSLDYFSSLVGRRPRLRLPYFGSTPAKVPRQNFYGFKSDYMRMDTESDVHGRTRLRRCHHRSQSAAVRQLQSKFPLQRAADLRSIPLTTPLSAVNVTRNVNSGNSQDSMLWDQADATFRFDTWGVGTRPRRWRRGRGRERATPESTTARVFRPRRF